MKYISLKGEGKEAPVIPKAQVRLNKGAVMLAEFTAKRYEINKDIRRYGKDLEPQVSS